MNSLNSIEDLDTTLKCPLCSHTYHNENNIPLIIPCQQNHTICSQCLSSLLAKPGKFHCPLDGTSPIQKGEDKIEFEMNKAFIQKIEDNCQHHPNRKLDLICKQCRCKICLACEKKGEHKGHETILLEEYERKFIMKLEEAQESVAKLNEIQSLKQNVLKSREKELLETLDILINEHIEKVNTKKAKMQEEIKRFFDSLKRDQELGLPCNDNQTNIFSDWKADIGNKINKIKESSPFNEVSFRFVDEEKILGASEIDNWLKLSRNSLEKFERDLEEVSVKFKIELETTLEEIDILDLKMKVTRKEKGELRDFEISTSSIIHILII